MGDYWTNAVRHPEDVGVGHIRRTVTYDQSGIATGIPIGTLEAGAIPLRCSVYVATAFNAGTTNTFVVGTTSVNNGIAVTGDVAAGAAGWKPNLSSTLTGIPLAADTTFYALYSQTGTAATAGKLTVIIEFVNKREIDGIPFPNN